MAHFHFSWRMAETSQPDDPYIFEIKSSFFHSNFLCLHDGWSRELKKALSLFLVNSFFLGIHIISNICFTWSLLTLSAISPLCVHGTSITRFLKKKLEAPLTEHLERRFSLADYATFSFPFSGISRIICSFCYFGRVGYVHCVGPNFKEWYTKRCDWVTISLENCSKIGSNSHYIEKYHVRCGMS